MDPITVGIIGFIILFVLLFLGLPVGFGMAIVGFAGIWYLRSVIPAISQVAFVPFYTISSYDLCVLPLFVLMAHVVFVSGISTDLYNLAAKWLGRLPGGLAIGTTAGCAVFAAISASSVATATTMCLVSYPEMRRYNYSPQMAAGSIAAGGTIGILIPPSTVLILYGIITETSIGRLFLGGIVPGILEALFYVATILILCTWKPSLGPRGPSFSFKEKMAAFGTCGEIIALIVLVLGGLVIGWFTPTEAGAVGALGSILFCTLRRRLDWQKFKQALLETMRTTGMLFLILIGAFLFKRFMALSTIPFWLADFVGGLAVPPLAIIAVIMVVYLFLGCIMDAAAMILLTIPVFLPLIVQLGFNPIWFGILVVRAVEIALITPPIGLNVYVIAGTVPDNLPMETIFKGVIPFLIADVLHVALLIFIPALTLWLPSIMM